MGRPFLFELVISGARAWVARLSGNSRLPHCAAMQRKPWRAERGAC